MDGADPAWRPSASVELIRLRSAVLGRLRAWFGDRGILEVDTPVLSRAGASDPHLENISAELGGRAYFLHTSPESAMKRLLAGGSGDIFQVCHVFRAGEQGRKHNPEFTMLEWYRLGQRLEDMMADVESLTSDLCSISKPLPSFRKTSYRDLMRGITGVDPFTAAVPELINALDSHGVVSPTGHPPERDELLDLLLATVVEPALDPEQPVFVYHFPASQAALARVLPGDPPLAERFELFFGGMEIANGFYELTDADEQGRRFDHELKRRAADNRHVPPRDDALLAALRAGLPDCSGVALGLDRLLMYLAGINDIRDVLTFDFSRA
ncbi:MAG: EF-P lysine aminoacylase GenX [Gammaproteobacteria bacterium]|nr:MAG: EF-P lysine aminoacylase GenX [Gammaproteobacteria bacterium]